MSRFDRRLLCCLLGMVLACPWAGAEAAKPVPSPTTGDERPDPSTVQRFGPAYRYPRAGWIVLHIEGTPYERGYQHGRLLAPELADYVKSLAKFHGPKAPADAWRADRTLVNSLFLRRYDKEYLEEMKGIADGAAAAGARFDHRPLDLLDVVAINSEIEVDFLDSALRATPHGLEGHRFVEPSNTGAIIPPADHCSAFAATGPATADGSVVFGHITMFHLALVRHFNVRLDVKPSQGHRVVMQTYPGGILSGMDYYLNDAGLIVAETTIAQTGFASEGQPQASRVRKALQYSDSIDGVVATLSAANNGLYTNEWLLADTKTNEIAMFELGTKKSKLWRSSKDEWVGGTKGFYWGCNNTKDLGVRLETVASLEGEPANVVFHPSERDRTWIRLYQRHQGKITADFGFEAFGTPPIAGFSSCDAKFTTSALVKDLKTWALFGPPLGRTWEPSDRERAQDPKIAPLVSNDWTLLTTDTPPAPARADEKTASEDKKVVTLPAVDLVPPSDDAHEHDPDDDETHRDLPPAWHGTILPQADADLWLAAAFSDLEKIVAREQAIRTGAKGRALSRTEQDKIDLGVFAPRSRYLATVERGRVDVPLDKIKPDFASDEWYQIASGKGVLLLAEIRSKLGEAAFLKLMDDFGRAHAGQPVTTAQFIDAVCAVPGEALKPTFFDRWLRAKGLPNDSPTAGFWSIHSFEAEPDQAVIVYGTLKDAHAQREAAEILQRQFARAGSNVTLPILADIDGANLGARHVLLIGRPDSNAITARFARTWKMPVSFGPSSFVLRGESYAHPATAVIAAGRNPLNPHRELVLFAGLSAESTRRCVQLGDRLGSPPAQVLLWASGAKPRRLVVPTSE